MYRYIHIFVWLLLHVCLSLSLSLYLCVYIYIYRICVPTSRFRALKAYLPRGFLLRRSGCFADPGVTHRRALRLDLIISSCTISI